MRIPAALVLTLISACLIGCAVKAGPTADATQRTRSPLPRIPGAGPQLWSVSCTAATTCWVMGETAKGFFSLHLRAGVWTYVPVPTPRGFHQPSGLWVSCVSDRDCWAAGGTNEDDDGLSGYSRDVVIHWNGSRWRLATVPNPRSPYENIVNDALQSISCPSASRCWAVGFRDTGEQLALGWNGKRWALASLPGGSNPNDFNLQSVSCVSARNCWAVGMRPMASGKCGGPFAADPTGNEILHWNGEAWVESVATSPTRCTNDLSLVSCVGARACWAIGQNDRGNEAFLWKGTGWRPTPIPTPDADPPPLTGLACTGKGGCWAVGTDFGTGTNLNVIFRYAAGRWRRSEVPPEPQGSGNELLGVSCYSASSCWAVGYSSPHNFSPEVMHWNGSHWSMIT